LSKQGELIFLHGP
jgi:hypothetical protein